MSGTDPANAWIKAGGTPALPGDGVLKAFLAMTL